MRLFPAQPPPNRLQISARSCEFHTNTDVRWRRNSIPRKRAARRSNDSQPQTISEAVGIIVTEFPEHAQRTVVQNTLGREGIFLEVLMLSLVLDQRTKSLEERHGSGGAFVHLPVPADQTYSHSQNACRLASSGFV